MRKADVVELAFRVRHKPVFRVKLAALDIGHIGLRQLHLIRPEVRHDAQKLFGLVIDRDNVRFVDAVVIKVKVRLRLDQKPSVFLVIIERHIGAVFAGPNVPLDLMRVNAIDLFSDLRGVIQ